MPPTANLSTVTRSSAGTVIRTLDAVVDSVDSSDMSIVARINTSSKDRYNTVIAARGGRFKNWRAGGMPVLWEHGKHPVRFTDPIANSKGVWNNGGPMPTEILAEPRFLKDDFSRQRFEWYRDDVIRGWSVNILPLGNSGPPTTEELRSRPDWEGVDAVYRDWDLAEFSGTVIPGNAEALTADRAARVLELVQRNLVWLPEDIKPLYDEAMNRTTTDSQGGMAGGGATVAPSEFPKRYITHSDGKWIVHAESGKVLGTHDNEADAKKQLAAIEAHKHDERSTPYLDVEPGVFVVRSMDGATILSTADEGLARDALEAITGQRRTFESLHFELLNSIRTDQEMRRQMREEFKTDITEMLNLMVYGRT